jgi:nitrite reductase (NADH) small subunit
MNRHYVGRLEDVPVTGPLMVTVKRLEIGIYRVGSELVAIRNFCPHQAAPVCRGTIAGTALPSEVYEYELGREGEILQCPWHGWEFDLLTGKHLVSQSRVRLRRYPVEVEDGAVYVSTTT